MSDDILDFEIQISVDGTKETTEAFIVFRHAYPYKMEIGISREVGADKQAWISMGGNAIIVKPDPKTRHFHLHLHVNSNSQNDPTVTAYVELGVDTSMDFMPPGFTHSSHFNLYHVDWREDGFKENKYAVFEYHMGRNELKKYFTNDAT